MGSLLLLLHRLQGTQPNIIGFAFNFMDEEKVFPKDLHYLVPNSYSQKPTILLYDHRIYMMSIIFVALERLDNQELFVNYRLNPNLKLPDWYEPVSQWTLMKTGADGIRQIKPTCS